MKKNKKYQEIIPDTYESFLKSLQLLDLITIHITGDSPGVNYRARVINFEPPFSTNGQPRPIVKIIRGGTKTLRQQKIKSYRFSIAPIAITRAIAA